MHKQRAIFLSIFLVKSIRNPSAMFMKSFKRISFFNILFHVQFYPKERRASALAAGSARDGGDPGAPPQGAAGPSHAALAITLGGFGGCFKGGGGVYTASIFLRHFLLKIFLLGSQGWGKVKGTHDGTRRAHFISSTQFVAPSLGVFFP